MGEEVISAAESESGGVDTGDNDDDNDDENDDDIDNQRVEGWTRARRRLCSSIRCSRPLRTGTWSP